jgi:hypothetical protein
MEKYGDLRVNRIWEKMKNSLIFTFLPEIKGNGSIDKVTARGDSKAGYRCSVVASEVV